MIPLCAQITLCGSPTHQTGPITAILLITYPCRDRGPFAFRTILPLSSAAALSTGNLIASTPSALAVDITHSWLCPASRAHRYWRRSPRLPLHFARSPNSAFPPHHLGVRRMGQYSAQLPIIAYLASHLPIASRRSGSQRSLCPEKTTSLFRPPFGSLGNHADVDFWLWRVCGRTSIQGSDEVRADGDAYGSGLAGEVARLAPTRGDLWP